MSRPGVGIDRARRVSARPDRKSTRLNSSHGYISYAVFCLKKKNQAQARHVVKLVLSVPRPGDPDCVLLVTGGRGTLAGAVSLPVVLVLCFRRLLLAILRVV